MKIQQMAFMLIAVTIFFVLVGLFLLMFRFSGLKQTAASLEEKNTLLLVTKLANSPEFSCGEAFGNKVNCIDADKAMILKDSISKYSNFWGSNVSNIIIRKIPVENNKECSKANYPDCDYIDVFSKGAIGTPVENFVTLCRKEVSENEVYDKCEIAKLMIYT